MRFIISFYQSKSSQEAKKYTSHLSKKHFLKESLTYKSIQLPQEVKKTLRGPQLAYANKLTILPLVWNILDSKRN